MKPRALIQQLKKGTAPAPGYLFIGAEPFFRDRCRRALKKVVLGEPADTEGYIDVDLKDQPLSRLIDETRTPSLFATSRLIVGRNAENVLPRGGGKHKESPAEKELAAYFKDPMPGTVLVIEATRFDSRERDDKAKLERVAKFFSAVPETVELNAMTNREALEAAGILAKQINLSVSRDLLIELVEMLGGDVARIESNLEKLALYSGEGNTVTRREIELLVPEARQSGAFEFSDALAHRDQARALQILDTISKAGTYWPMQLNLIAGLFRQALAAKELELRGPGQVGQRLGSYGMRLWPARARQVAEIAGQFGVDELRRSLVALFEADRELRSTNPEDRLIIEHLVVRLTN